MLIKVLYFHITKIIWESLKMTLIAMRVYYGGNRKAMFPVYIDESARIDHTAS